MANNLITIDDRELLQYARFNKNTARGIFFSSVRATLNDMAFSTQKQAKFNIIPKSMNTRGNFNQSLIRVNKAKGRGLTSFVGAINKNGYDGLKNIELARKESNPAIPTLKESRGNKSRKLTPSKRLRRLGKFARPKTKRGLMHLSLNNYKGAFEINNKFSKLNPGIFKFGERVGKTSNGLIRRKILKLRDTEHNPTTPKKNKWLWKSTLLGASSDLTNRFYQRHFSKNYNRAVIRLSK